MLRSRYGLDCAIINGEVIIITAANHVIHLSRMWNPAKEDQATNRVYRIGQVTLFMTTSLWLYITFSAMGRARVPLIKNCTGFCKPKEN
ncbi:hypothetical protein MOMUL_12940 [Moorella mulderi DSM 14980]|uniref:Uncharacterized protein n=1 Tax=Moorella mulderi DSM 14980 TaxID=1122241 RepID=A0A151AYR6_9FIRM|nr:hypothetical protein [Moorella mulderi]KYH32692.1 hypothetical protein MOMUL_12940 [Moorella mulderi DSM 14980]